MIWNYFLKKKIPSLFFKQFASTVRLFKNNAEAQNQLNPLARETRKDTEKPLSGGWWMSHCLRALAAFADDSMYTYTHAYKTPMQ